VAATIIPLIALGIIIAVLVMAWPRKPPPGSPPPTLGPYPKVTRPLTRSERELLERHERQRQERLFDKAPFGEALARRMWRKAASARVGEGIIPNRHKEYCGHGLVRTAAGGVALHEVQDGHVGDTPVIASWDDEESFVGFFARQSNHSVNGYDPAEPIFYTDNEWARGNQRLNRQDVESALGRFF
jgi:hypothetical protein